MSRERITDTTESNTNAGFNVFYGTSATSDIIPDRNIVFTPGAATTNGVFTIQPGYGGDYYLEVTATFNVNTGTASTLKQVNLQIVKGLVYNVNVITQKSAIVPYDNRFLEQTISCIVALVPGDQITFWYNPNSIGTTGTAIPPIKIATGTVVNMYKLGGPKGADGSLLSTSLTSTTQVAGLAEDNWILPATATDTPINDLGLTLTNYTWGGANGCYFSGFTSGRWYKISVSCPLQHTGAGNRIVRLSGQVTTGLPNGNDIYIYYLL